LQGDKIFRIGGQRFKVTGPHSGYTAFGRAVKYWKLVNKDKFLIWDGGGDVKQYIRSGDAILHYDAGNTRLLLHDDVLRTVYHKGDRTDNTIQYIANLTSATAFPSQATSSGLSHLLVEPFGTGLKPAVEPESVQLPVSLAADAQAQANRPTTGSHVASPRAGRPPAERRPVSLRATSQD
jgi:hypothetical protein